MAEQKNGEHYAGSNERGWCTRYEGIEPEDCNDEEVADPLPTKGKQGLEEEKLYDEDDDADVET